MAIADPIRDHVSTWSRVASVGLLLFACGLGPPAEAQGRGPEHSSECLPRATRAREHCDPIRTVVRSEGELEVTLDVPTPKAVYCAPVVAFEYSQRDTVVDITGTISNADCAACSGEYEVVVSVRDESQGLKMLRFVETWQRQDDHPVTFAAHYPIGTNVDLVGVRARSLRCTCLRPQQEHSTAPREEGRE